MLNGDFFGGGAKNIGRLKNKFGDNCLLYYAYRKTMLKWFSLDFWGGGAKHTFEGKTLRGYWLAACLGLRCHASETIIDNRRA